MPNSLFFSLKRLSIIMELYGRCLCGLLKNYRSISLWSHVKKKELLQSSTIQYIGTTFGFLRSLISVTCDDEINPPVEVADDIVVQSMMGDVRVISEEVRLIWPERSAKATQEFKHPNPFAKCFPTIFPYGLGDATSPNRPFVVTLAEGITHLEKCAYYSESDSFGHLESIR